MTTPTLNPRAAELIETLELEKHPESGYFVELFRSRHEVMPADSRGKRSAQTMIYYLLLPEGGSIWHRIRSDELWHFYEGSPLELFHIEPDSFQLQRHRLGPLFDDQKPVHLVPAGHWQAARTLGAYTLVGCTVGPGFQFDDFELLRETPDSAKEVRQRYPELPLLS